MGNIKNILNSSIPMNLDKERHYNLTFKGLRYLAEKHGGAMKAFNKMADIKMQSLTDLEIETIDLVIDFLYAGLMWEDKDLTPEDVQGMLNMANVVPLFGEITAAINASLPEATGSPNPQTES